MTKHHKRVRLKKKQVNQSTNMNSKLITIALLISCGITRSAHAAEVYTADPEHTFVSLSYKHLNYSVQTIRFDKVTGTITLNDENNGGTIDMTIDTKSISTGSDTFNERIQEDDFFATEQFPVATFKSDNIIFQNNGVSEIEGALTIKDITKPILIEVNGFSCSRNFLTLKHTCGANAIAKLSRSDFNMGKYAPFVGDDVTINIAIEASRE